VAVNPSGKFLYSLNLDDNNISAFSINQSNGGLTPINTIASDQAPVAMTFDPTGQFAYVANFGSGDVTIYRILANGDLGLLGAVPDSPNPSAIAIHATGNFAYVTHSTSNDVTLFQRNPTTGSITPQSPTIQTQNGPTSAVADAQGKFLYVTNTNSGTVSVFSTDATSLTPRSAANAGINPIALTLDAAGKFAYVADVASNKVIAFSVDQTTGALTAVGTPANTESAPTRIAFSK